MKVNIISGPFISAKMLVKLTPYGPVKDPVFVQISSLGELSKKLKEVGAIEVETIGHEYLFKEGM